MNICTHPARDHEVSKQYWNCFVTLETFKKTMQFNDNFINHSRCADQDNNVQTRLKRVDVLDQDTENCLKNVSRKVVSK